MASFALPSVHRDPEDFEKDPLGKNQRTGDRDMKIECFLSEGCGSQDKLNENLQKALMEERIKTEVSFREISQKEAERLGIGGSPTVWINGQDLEPGAPPGSIS